MIGARGHRETPQCTGIRRDGQRCLHSSREGSDRCAKHHPCAVANRRAHALIADMCAWPPARVVP